MQPSIFLLVVAAISAASGAAFPAAAKSQLDELVAQAESGDAKAQYKLGELSLYPGRRLPDGSWAKQDSKVALKWLRSAAGQGLPEAQYRLGEVLYVGDGLLDVEPDELESSQWLLRFLQHPKQDEDAVVDAQFMLGVEYFQECDPYWDRRRPGDNRIRLDGCGLERRGNHATQNPREAVKYLRMAADSGHPAAQHRLAQMYQTGKGVPQDYAEAARLYQLAAESTYYLDFYRPMIARGPLGSLYAEMKDYISAHMWLNLAASADDPWAAEARDNVAKLMTPEQIAKAQRLAREWDAKHGK